ncbi:FAD-dependent oxidoreductase [Polystyrenella longa]|uniref:FAD-dependent oxidoreductase n=1 Tax=Polystyrenella longa TaxID=2528007 RepID=UPI0018D1FBC2|nr:FAD-dependent oxidoreductase [Polystyrenella longa]
MSSESSPIQSVSKSIEELTLRQIQQYSKLMSDTTSYDIIIVGGGGSGLAAAVSAAESGAQVLLLEKQEELGGTTGIAVGSFTGCETSLQKSEGINDSFTDHVIDAGLFAKPEIESKNNGDLRNYFLSQTSETFDWLISLGLHFYGPSPEPPNRVPRMHNVVPGAKAYIATLQSRFQKLGGEIICSTPVVELIQENEEIIGVVTEREEKRKSYYAKVGVVLAAGDYANSSEILKRFKGSEFAAIDGINPRATGDGHLLAEAVGAKLLNMEITYGPELRFIPPPGKTFQQLLPVSGFFSKVMGRMLPLIPRFVVNHMVKRLLVTWQHPEDSLFERGAILINQNGQRFCDETKCPDREIAVAQQPGKQCYLLLDERLIGEFSKWPNFISTAPEIAYTYIKDYEHLRSDITVRRTSIEEIAQQRSIPIEELTNTVKSYNQRAVEAGRPLLNGNDWVLLGPACAYFTTTEGGVAINERFAAINAEGEPISGLFAIGQNGLGGQILWGHGLHIAWALTSGRLVGKQLAEKVKDS